MIPSPARTAGNSTTRRRRRLPWTVVGMAALAVAAAGRGGHSSTAAKPVPSGATPQGNGGPSDGDGNV